MPRDDSASPGSTRTCTRSRASKDEYLEIEYGATRTNDTGTAIAIEAGQQVTGLSVWMVRGGVISGTVRRADGEPATATAIDLARPGLPGLFASGVRTNAEGVYRIAGLGGGQYHVIAHGPKGSVPVLYPGVIDPLLATTVRVEEEQGTGSHRFHAACRCRRRRSSRHRR